MLFFSDSFQSHIWDVPLISLNKNDLLLLYFVQGLSGWDSGEENREDTNWATDSSLATMAQVWLMENGQGSNQSQQQPQSSEVAAEDKVKNF